MKYIFSELLSRGQNYLVLTNESVDKLPCSDQWERSSNPGSQYQISLHRSTCKAETYEFIIETIISNL